MKTIELKYLLKKVALSPKEEPVLMGEITLAVNVIERVKHQNPGLYEKVLDMIMPVEDAPIGE
jgi:hypothetical protein